MYATLMTTPYLMSMRGETIKLHAKGSGFIFVKLYLRETLN